MNVLSLQPVTEDVTAFYESRVGFKKDAGIDLYCTEDQVIPAHSESVLIDFQIILSMQRKRIANFGEEIAILETGNEDLSYYLYPRSSMGSKTPLRMANSIGVIDAGYRGHVMAAVDNRSSKDYTIKRGDRLFQICAADLKPIHLQIVAAQEATDRGSGGFGSTGK